MEFIKFLGRAALNGKQVAVYRDGEQIIVKPETIGCKPVRYQAEIDGERVWRTCATLRMTEDQYDSWEDMMAEGLMPGDVNIVRRALIECGYPE